MRALSVKVILVSIALFLSSPIPLFSQSLSLTSPNGSEQWEEGTSHAITWTSTGNIKEVEIKYSLDSGYSWTSVSGTTDNDGIYYWTLPTQTPAEGLVNLQY